MTNRMIIGGDDREVDYTSACELRFDQGELAFEPLASYLTALHGFVSLLEVYKHDGKGAYPWAPDDIAIFDGSASDIRLHWNPHDTVIPMIHNSWPLAIVFTQHDAARVPDGEMLNLGALDHFISGLGQSLLVSLFEGQKPLLEATYDKIRDWPAEWQFARIVRNAMSHGGRIKITDGRFGSWRRLSYTDADNGRPIINSDIWPADLFILAKDLQASLP